MENKKEIVYNSAFEATQYINERNYWLHQMSGELTRSAFPYDRKKSPERPRMLEIPFSCPGDIASKLMGISGNSDLSLHLVLMAGFILLLNKYTLNDDIIVGTPIYTEETGDPMSNKVLAIRQPFQEDSTFKELLLQVRDTIAKACENYAYPIEKLCEQLNLPGTGNEFPLFDAALVMENIQAKSDLQDIPCNIVFSFLRTGSDIGGTVVFNALLYKTATIERIAGHFLQLLRNALFNPDLNVREIEILPEEEKRCLLEEFGRQPAFYPGDKTIHQLFEEQAARTPDHIAVVGPAQSVSLTYRRLNEQADRLAGLLIEKNVQPGTIVGIIVERSVEMIVGLLGILKSGGAYLPIDPGTPHERTDYMLKDSGAELLVTTNDREGEKVKRWEGEKILLEDISQFPLPSCLQNSSNLAYVIYTSGTTGRPKGVLIRHRGFINLVCYHRGIFGENRDSRISQVASPAFDAMGFEVWPCLLSGAALHIVDDEIRLSPPRLRDWLIRRGITISFQSTAMAEHLLAERWPDEGVGLKALCTAGDKLNRYPGYTYPFKLYNLYGPTEDTVWTTWTVVESDPDPVRPPVIGKPVANHLVCILNSNLKLQPVGTPGELCISGVGLAAGYLNNPELTAEKFVPNDLLDDRCPTTDFRLYKTGDLARWLDDGNIEFIGRIDHQVKIRGFRVELAEIEHRLSKHAGIKEAVVLVQEEETGDKYLCAYVVSRGENTIPGLPEFLAKELPDYMIPSYFVPLEKIPLTPNGKVDRRALPKPELKAGQDYVAPRNETEAKLAGLWAEVLNIRREIISIDGNFFQLGGHSLKATVLASRVHKELNVVLPLAKLFKTPTIRGMAEYLDHAARDTHMSITAVEKKEYYQLSPAQKRIYILQQMELTGTAYNMPQIIPIPVEWEIEKLEASFKQLIARHESLRTSFHMIGDQPVQRVHEDVGFKIERYEESGAAGFSRPFDLSRAPLLRVWALKTAEGRGYLLVDIHHIVTDGVSQEILKREFMSLYAGEELPGLRIHYKDFSQWRHSETEIERLRRQTSYWLEEYAGEIPVLELPTDYPRPATQSFEGDVVTSGLPVEECRALNALALEEGSTLFMALAAVVNVLLSKLSGMEEIIVGTPTAGRRHSDLQKIIGMFVNTLALKNYPVGERTFKEFLGEVKKRVLTAFENQEYPFEELVDKLSLKRDIGRNPLFDVMFTLHDMSGDPDVRTGESGESEGETGWPVQPDLPGEDENMGRVSKFDLTFGAVVMAHEIRFSIQYCTRLFKKETIEGFMTYFKKILWSVVNDPGIKLRDIDILSREEKERLLFDFNITGSEYPVDKTIHGLFEEQVERTPGNIAAVDSHVQLTYRELNEKSNRTANALRDLGIGPGDIVGIKTDRSTAMVAGILAILKSGGAYLPLNPKNPSKRTRYMLRDCGAKVLLAQQGYGDDLSDICEVIDLTAAGSPGTPTVGVTSPDAPAYIIYTSGSTGNPKGVRITHANFSPLVHWGYRDLGISGSDRFVQNLSYFFDWSVWEIFLALTTGAGLYLTGEEVLLSGEALGEYIGENKITVLHITPSQFQTLVGVKTDGKPVKLSSLNYLFIGAEKLEYDLVKRGIEIVNGHCRIFNMYGPTEATIIASVLEIGRKTAAGYGGPGGVPIGIPVGNTQLYVFDKYFNPCPEKVTGELYIGGDGLAAGYVNNVELTAERFKRLNRSYKSYRSDNAYTLYKTGDLVRRLPGGELEFLGRIDHQVKLRGYRIEPGEIRDKLLENQSVKAAVVTVSADKQLCAYVVPAAAVELEVEFRKKLKDYLQQQIPAYMVPSYIELIENIPLTPNGKLDLKALPEPEVQLGGEYAGPRDAVEETLVEIWSEILAIKKEVIGIDNNFFELGGHSLKATVLVSRVHKELNVAIPLTELFTSPTIRELSEYLGDAVRETHMSITAAEKKEYYVLSPAQKRIYILQQMALTGTAYNMPEIIPIPGEVDIDRLEGAFKKLIERHESLRTSFHMIGAQPVQKVHGEVAFKIEKYEESDVHQFVRAFDLSCAPLLRVDMLKTADRGNYLAADMHHIISDGVSHQVLREDFMALYNGKELPPLPLQYKDFAQWQNSGKEVERLQRQMSYWLKEFEGEIPVLELPVDHPRPTIQSFEGDTLKFEISAEETRALNALALEVGATRFMVLTAALNILFSKLSGQEDIIIGTPVAGRRHSDLEKIIGMFINTLALRNYPTGDITFREFLGDVRDRVLTAFENQEYPFEELVDKLSLKRDLGRNPLFDVMFVLHNINTGPAGQDEDTPSETGPSLQPGFPKEYEGIARTAKFDLTITAVEGGPETLFSLQYCIKLFKKESVGRFVGCFKKIVSLVLNEPGIRLNEIDIISEEEKKRVLYDFNRTEAEYPGDKTIHRLFEEQVERTPDRVALVGAAAFDRPARTVSLTYRELNVQSARLAWMLIEKGILAGNIVGIKIERSIDMIVGIFGILKAGGAYLPIDPGYPTERIDYMLKDSGAKLLLTTGKSDNLTCLPSYLQNSSNLAYIIYTSGSTGMPKGVMIEHRSVVNRLNWMQKAYPIDHGDVILQKTTVTFDVSVWELFWWSSRGARVGLLGAGGEKDPAAIVDAVARRRVTTMHFVPSMLNVFLDYLENEGDAGAASNKLRSLRQVFASGEALGPVHVERFYRLAGQWGTGGAKGARLINLYGPTEATVDVSYFDCSPCETYRRIPIGRPIDNTQLLVLDRYGHLQPPGIPGELHIGGDCLARGYLNRPDLTAQRFCNNRSYKTHNTYRSYYKTGDLARRLDDGNIEFLGRIDHQVKIRGFRIELGEIENRLLAHPAVKEAAAAARIDPSGDNRLVAYVTPDETTAFTIHRLLEIEGNNLHGDRPRYGLPNGMPVFYLNRGETDFMYREIFEEHSYVRHGITLPEGSCIFDIGANIGLFSLFANSVCRDAVIYSFEPAPPLYDLLALNTSLYGTNFKIFNNGISSVAEEVEFTYYPHAGILSGRFADDAEEKETVRAFIHRELEAAGDHRPTEEQIDELLEERLSGVRFDCVMKTVSQVMRENGVERIDLLKVDVEKAELDVLEGIETADWPKIRQLVIEVHDNGDRLKRIMDLLETHEYKVVVEQDSMLEETGLYNLYAVQARHAPEREQVDGESAVVPEEPGRYDPGRLIDNLKESLKERLPDYMIPPHFVLLDKMPLTASGKVDRKALPEPEAKRGERYEAPANETEEKLVGIWSEILGIEKTIISTDVGFFELGGHSLKATLLASRVQREFHVSLPLLVIFKSPTITELGEYLTNASGAVRGHIHKNRNLVLLRKGEAPNRDNHLFLVHDVSGEVEGYMEFCRNLDIDFNCWGIRAHRLEDFTPIDRTIEELAEKYIEAIREIQPMGPYYIAGWSIGGSIAFEVVRQMENMGREIAFLAMVDSPPPQDCLLEKVPGFNLQSEKDFISKYFKGKEVKEILKRAAGMDNLWPTVINYLETADFDPGVIRKIVVEVEAHVVPNYHQLEIAQLIHYLNRGRTFRRARALYTPSREIYTPAHYFAAAGSQKKINKEHWNEYCREPLTFHEIGGDHFTIFQDPHVAALADSFHRIIKQS